MYALIAYNVCCLHLIQGNLYNNYARVSTPLERLILENLHKIIRKLEGQRLHLSDRVRMIAEEPRHRGLANLVQLLGGERIGLASEVVEEAIALL